MDEYDFYYGDGRNAVRRMRAPAPASSRAVFVPPPSAQPAPASAPVFQPASTFQPAPVFQPGMPPSPFYGGQPAPYSGPTYGYPPAFSTYAAPPPPYAAPYAAPAYPAPYGSPYGAPPYGVPMPGYPMPMGGSQGGGLLQGLGGMNLGTLASLGLAGYAALKQLPPPPIAGTDVATNLANLITYQSELAKHAKLDEQLRTAGALAEKLYPVL
jgi:hypothetical protein